MFTSLSDELSSLSVGVGVGVFSGVGSFSGGGVGVFGGVGGVGVWTGLSSYGVSGGISTPGIWMIGSLMTGSFSLIFLLQQLQILNNLLYLF